MLDAQYLYLTTLSCEPRIGNSCEPHKKQSVTRVLNGHQTLIHSTQPSCTSYQNHGPNVGSGTAWRLLLLATSSCFLLPLTCSHLTQHDDTVAVHESNSRQPFAILERVAYERLLRLECTLRHLVRLQGVRFFHFLSTCFLAHLPDELRDAAR